LAIQFLDKLLPAKTRGTLTESSLSEFKEKLMNSNTYSSFALQMDLLKAAFDIDVIVRQCS